MFALPERPTLVPPCLTSSLRHLGARAPCAVGALAIVACGARSELSNAPPMDAGLDVVLEGDRPATPDACTACDDAQTCSKGRCVTGGETNLVLFGGDSEGEYAQQSWIWNGATWTLVSVAGPSSRAGAVMAPLNGAVLLFGGMGPSATILSDTWSWDGSS